MLVSKHSITVNMYIIYYITLFLPESFTVFHCDMWLYNSMIMTALCDYDWYMILSHVIWQFVTVTCDVTLYLNSNFQNKE